MAMPQTTAMALILYWDWEIIYFHEWILQLSVLSQCQQFIENANISLYLHKAIHLMKG